MPSTGADLLKNGEGQYIPQGYHNQSSGYKAIDVLEYNSSQYGPVLVTPHRTATVTVTTSTDGLSGVVDLGPYRVVAVEMSTAWTAGDITFAAASSSGGTYYPVYDDNGSEITIIGPSAARIITVEMVGASLAPLRHVKFRSGTNDTPVTQAASRALTLILKG